MMYGHIGGLKLSIDQFLEVCSDDNRFFTSRALSKRFEEVTLEDLLKHYVANTYEPRTVHTFHVEEDEQFPLFVGS